MRTGPGPFDDERAVATASAVVSKLMECARVQSMAQYANSDPFEIGEVCVMPLLELVRIICMNSGARPPRLHVIDELAEFHMHLYNRRAADEYGTSLAESRREGVIESFERLRLVSRSYWQSSTDLLQ